MLLIILGLTVSARFIPRLIIIWFWIVTILLSPFECILGMFVVDGTVETFEYCVFCKKKLLCLSAIIPWSADPSFLLHQVEINNKPPAF